MQRKGWWFASAVLIGIVVGYGGLVAAFMALNQLASIGDSSDRFSTLASWICLLGASAALLGVNLFLASADRPRLRSALATVMYQAVAVMLGTFFGLVFISSQEFGPIWVPIFGFLAWALDAHRRRNGAPLWQRLSLLGLTIVAAAFPVSLAYL